MTRPFTSQLDLAKFATLALAMAAGCSSPDRTFSGDGGEDGSGGDGQAGDGDGDSDGDGDADSGAGGMGDGGLGGIATSSGGEAAHAGGAAQNGSGGTEPWVATPTACEADEISIDRPAAVGFNYCIDSHEVTRGEYQAFLNTLPGAEDNVGPECSWNTNFDPTVDPQGECVNVATNFLYGSNGDLPVTCVDWCDAAAYCSAIGRHLCSGVEGQAVEFGTEEGADPDVDQWYRACSGGTRLWPYDSIYEGNICHDNFSAPTAVRAQEDQFNSCVGFAAGLFDMSGNAREWTDSCSGTEGASDTCQVRGGGFKDGQTATRCDYLNLSHSRDTLREDVGFRCCSN